MTIKPEHIVACPHCGVELDITDQENVSEENYINCANCEHELHVWCTVTIRVDGVEDNG